MTVDSKKFKLLEEEIIHCIKCPRLVQWREEVARVKRKAFLEWTYWGKPVPGFGDLHADVMAVGLAPGAHGSNRTGRMFTGDGSGDFLYPILNQTGFANQPTANDLGDGLKLSNLFITAVCRCAPPGNKPVIEEILACQDFLIREIHLIQPKIFVVLGRIAYERILAIFSHNKKDFPFKHGANYKLSDKQRLICSYHPSRQNTQTGRLTSTMFRNIWEEAAELISMN